MAEATGSRRADQTADGAGPDDSGRFAVLAGLLWLVTAGLTVTSLIIVTRPVSGPVPGRPTLVEALATLTVVLAYATMGALLIHRRPGNPVGWLLSAVGICVSVSILASAYAGLALVVQPGSWPAGAFAAWLNRVSGVLAVLLAGPILILVFPDGRLPSPRWRPAALVLGIGAVLGILNLALAPGAFPDFRVANPFGLDAIGPIGQPLDALVNALLVVGTVGALLSVVARFRRADPIQRQQLKWFGYVAAVVAVALIFSLILGDSSIADAAFNVFVLSLSGLPIAVGVAVLRFRLYDIDVLIGRTLVYVPLTALLAGLYTASVSLFQRIFVAITGDKSDAAIVFATLILATAFTPVRKWLEGIVERRYQPRHEVPMSEQAAFADADWDARMEAIATRVARREIEAASTPAAMPASPSTPSVVD
jgi:hypothetical protein